MSANIAIFLHLYHTHTWDDIYARLIAFPFHFNLYVNLVSGHSDDMARTITSRFPNAIINISPNQGMDPGGQLRTLDYWLKNGQNEEFLIFIHSKNNDSLRELMMSIITPIKAKCILYRFTNNTNIGMIGTEEWNIYPPRYYGDPIHFCDYYCNKLGLNNFETKKFGFIGGTQFWVRSSIYKELFQNISIPDLVAELPAYDTGGMTHALERIFGYIVLSAGYKIEGIGRNKSMTLKQLFWNRGGYSYYPTDKDTHHNYLQTYSELFQIYEKEPITLLEVGVYKGGSLRLFEDYFINATIIGYDIKDWGDINCTRATRIIKNFSEVSAAELPNNITIAIEDGAHDLNSQIEFVQKVRPKMVKEGIMVIEDIFTRDIQQMKDKLRSMNISFEIFVSFPPKDEDNDNLFIIRT